MSTAFRITLSGSEQVPPVASSAAGLGVATFNSSNTSLSYVITTLALDWGPLLGRPAQTPGAGDDVNGEHFHSGDRGTNGSVVFDWFGQDTDDFVATLNGDGSWTISGIWETTDSGSTIASFASALSSATLGADAPLYANVHTTSNGAGEIRGQLVCIATDSSETVTGTVASDYLPGLGGNDTLIGGAGSNTIDGGTGINTADYSASPGAITVNLTTGSVVNGYGGTDSLTNIQIVKGSTHGSSFTGGPGDNTLVITGGNNTVVGGTFAGTSITEFSVPSAGATPFSITTGLDGNVWFTEVGTGKIGRIAPDGTFAEFRVPTPGGITVGPDGAIWFTEIPGNSIARLAPDGSITEFALLTPGSVPHRLTLGPDGALWVAEAGTDKIARVTASGVVTEFAIPTPGGTPFDIITGPDGALWFTEIHSNKIGRITTAGVITEFTVGDHPSQIVAGPDGALWFSESDVEVPVNPNKIGRLTTGGVFSEFSPPTPDSKPQGITFGPDGAFWFVERVGNNLGRLTTTGAFNELAVPTPASGVYGITGTPDGKLYFTEFVGNKIAQVTPGSLTTLDYSGAPGSTTINLAAGTAANGFGGTDNFANVTTFKTGAANDTVIGGAGSHSLDGGGGTNTLDYSAAFGAVIVNLFTGMAANGFGNVDQFVNFQTIKTGNGSDRFIVGAGSHNLDGQAGSDTVDYSMAPAAVSINLATASGSNGFGGTDSYAGVENAVGSASDDMIAGDGAANTLDGGAGIDVLFGGSGNDTLVGSNAGDQLYGSLGNDVYIVHNAAAGAFENAGEGADVVQADVSYALGSNIEALLLTGAAAINGTGNNLDNTINGNAAGNILNGGTGEDVLFGGGGSDTLFGNSSGDQLYGAAGDDVYYLSSGAIGAFENAGEGTDWVNIAANYSLGSHIENLVLMGAGDFFGNGNGLANFIYSNNASDTLSGAGGNDTLFGGTGVDAMYGGAGNDLYYVHNSAAGVFENAAEGTDWVFADVNFTMGSHLENLQLTGSGNLFANGNGLDNLIYSNGANDTLFGGGGNDTLTGGAGTDAMYGSAGNDIYYVHNASAGAFENVGEGTDWVYADVSYAIGSNVENLVLVGSGNVSGTGNGADNRFEGNGGNNTFAGSGGADRFVFAAAGTAHDTITDFDAANAAAGHDVIDLSGRSLSFAALTINQVGADTQILVGSDEITLSNVLEADVDAGDFLF